MKPFNKLQLEFMLACSQPRFSLQSSIDAFRKGYCDSPLLLQQVSLWKELIHEEVNHELFLRLQRILHYSRRYSGESSDLFCHLADDIGDSIYVLCGLANSLGIPIHLVFEEIHRANMRKAVRQEDGSFKVLRREDGKILKPEGWHPPDIERVLENYIVTGEENDDLK